MENKGEKIKNGVLGKFLGEGFGVLTRGRPAPGEEVSGGGVLGKFPGEGFSPAAAPGAVSAGSRCGIRAPALCAGARGSLPCASGHAWAPAWVQWLRH